MLFDTLGDITLECTTETDRTTQRQQKNLET